MVIFKKSCMRRRLCPHNRHTDAGAIIKLKHPLKADINACGDTRIGNKNACSALME